MIKAKRFLDRECMDILLPEAYDVYSISDWEIWEIVWEMDDDKTVSYVLVTRTGPRTRKLHSVMITRDELSQTILNLAQGVDE